MKGQIIYKNLAVIVKFFPLFFILLPQLSRSYDNHGILKLYV